MLFQMKLHCIFDDARALGSISVEYPLSGLNPYKTSSQLRRRFKVMRNSVRWMVMFLLTAIASVSQLPAQSGSGAITGTVQDANGSILVSAKVTVEPSGRQAASNDQGQFRITNLPAGDYTLTTSYVGFAVSTTKV